MSSILLVLVCSMVPLTSLAKLNVITTTTNLESLAKAIGGDKIEVLSFCKGTQDPHYIEAKPSYMVKASKADLLISIGLELEVGWLPLILRGSRNPKIKPGGAGSLVAGDFIDALEKPTSAISRADGDVHPEGNPHFLLDPLNAIKIAEKLKDKLASLDPTNSETYERNYKIFSQMLNAKMVQWHKILQPGTNVISYHKTLTYFYNRFGINNVALLEPKPGVPPSASHILSVIKKAKSLDIHSILVENYFDPTVANRVAKEIAGMKVSVVPVSVGGEREIKTLVDLYEKLVQIAAEARRGNS